MRNIFKSDLYRLWVNNWSMVDITIVFLIISMPVLFNGNFQMTLTIGSSGVIPETIIDLIKIQMALDNIFYYLFIIPVGLVINSDISSSAAKNTVSSVVSRKKYFFSKYAFIVTYNVIIFIFYMFVMYFADCIINGYSYTFPVQDALMITLAQLPIMIFISSLLTFYAFVFKRAVIFTSVSLLTEFAYLVFLKIASLINNNISKYNVFENIIYKYEIQNAIISVTSEPLSGYTLSCAVVFIFGSVIITALGYAIFRKQEI